MEIFILLLLCIINYVTAGTTVKNADFNSIPFPQDGVEFGLMNVPQPGFAAYYATPPQNQHFYVSVYPLQLCSSVVVRVSDKKFEPPYKFETTTFKGLQVIYNPMKREILITDGANELLKGFWDKPYISFFYNAAAKKYELTSMTAYTGKEENDVKTIKRTPIDMGKSMVVTTSGRFCRTLVNYVGNDKWVHIGTNLDEEYNVVTEPAAPKVDTLPAVTNLLKKALADNTPGVSNCLKSTTNAQFTRFLADAVWQTKDTEFKVQTIKTHVTAKPNGKVERTSLKLTVGTQCDFVKIQFGDKVDPTFQLDLFPSASFFVPPHTSEGEELHINGKRIPFYQIKFNSGTDGKIGQLNYFATGASTFAFSEAFQLPIDVSAELKKGMNIHVVYSPQCDAAIIEDVPAPLSGRVESQTLRIQSCTSRFLPAE